MAGNTTFAVVLAGGEGSRLREITTTPSGEVIPKQFCSLQSESCLLQDATRRARAVALPHHICSVVAEQHHHWWSAALKDLPEQNIFVQPKNRGTANGILLALLKIERRDPNAIVALLPADHYVADEERMARCLRAATSLASDDVTRIYLLGAEPDHADPELGYIVPERHLPDASAGVIRFVEKPTLEEARKLIERGALWNTFIFAGSVQALLNLFRGSCELNIDAISRALTLSTKDLVVGYLALESVYNELEALDFSQDILEHHPKCLQVLAVPSCGWTDLGTPKRVEETIQAQILHRRRRSAPQSGTHPPFFDLSSGYGHLCLPRAS